MKKILIHSCLFFALCFGSVLSAYPARFADKCIHGKFYVEPGSIHVGPKGIFLHYDENFIPIGGISVDERGVYVVDTFRIYCLGCEQFYDPNTQDWRCPHDYLSEN